MIKPSQDRVLVERIEQEKVTESGIYISTKRVEEVWYGTVLAVGPKVNEVKVGDEIAYKAFATVPVEDEGKKLLLVKEEEVYGVIYE